MTSKSSTIAALSLMLSQMLCLGSKADELPESLPDEVAYSISAEDSVIQRINDLTNEILLREIELQRLNALFRIESTRQPRLRAWRQFLYSQINSNLTEAGLIGRMALSYRYLKENSGRPDRGAVERCAGTSMVGQLIAATGDSCEVLVNLRNYAKAGKKGLDPRSYREKLTIRAQELDILLLERDQLISSAKLAEPDLRIVKAETALLKDVRDLVLVQYVQYHAGAKKLRFFQNSAYLINISRNLLGATSNVLNIRAARLGNIQLSSKAALLNLIAGAFVVAAPVVGRVSGNLAGFVDRRIVSKDFADIQVRETEKFTRDRLDLTRILSAPAVLSKLKGEEAKRAQIYSFQEALLLDEEMNISRQRKQGRIATVENVVTGTVVGASRMTAGILGMVGARKYADRPWMSARCTAAASTVYGAGTAFNVVETGRVRFCQELQNRQDERRGFLPRQLLQRRLDALNRMSESLRRKEMMAAKSDSFDTAR